MEQRASGPLQRNASAAASSSSPLTIAHNNGSKGAAPQSKGTSNGLLKPVNAVRKVPGGIQINTIKRVVAPAKVSPTPSPGLGVAPRINGLSEEKRQRVEEIRRERERKQREEEERLRPAKKRTTQTSIKSVKRRKVESGPKSDSDHDDLFSEAEADINKKAHKMQSSKSSQGYQKLGRSGVMPVYTVARDLIDTSAFHRGPDVLDPETIQSSSLVHGKAYGPFFANLREDQSQVTLEYPAHGAAEDFSLLVPKDRDEYDPISDLLRTVRCIVEYYLTPEQQEQFGSLDALEIGSAAGHTYFSGVSKATSPLPTSRETSVFAGEQAKYSNGLHPASAGHMSEKVNEILSGLPSTELLDSPAGSASTPLSPAPSANFASIVSTASSSPTQGDSSIKSNVAEADSILRSFTKARNRRDGSLFIRTVDRFNNALQALKSSGAIEENVRRMGETGVAEGIWRCIQEQAYARTVAPRVEELAKYEAFSDNVYGELLPRFMSEISQLTDLKADSCFVDLGSGVGNLLIQVALQTGSQAYGCEMMKVPSELAKRQIEEAQRRWKMWGLQGGDCQAWQGDFGEDERIREVLRRADVVLVNNYAFTAPTNDKLSLQFLDLKDGAKIISLKPFVPPDFRLTERTLSSPLAILRVAQRLYTSGCVSWADGGGKYFIHTVDRSMITKFLENRNSSADGRKGDVSKKQWKAADEKSEKEL